jgi:hypothetical protein
MSEEQNISEKTAKLVKEEFYQGGIEDKLENVGGVFFILGIIGGIVSFILAFGVFEAERDGVKAGLVCVGALAVFGGYINQVLLKAIAEIIRLLKKIAGMKFSGEITQPEASTYDKCSTCDSPVNETDEICPSCGAKFEK